MTSPQSRRDVLKGTAALAVAATVGTAMPTRRAHAQAGRGARIDSVLKQAVDAKDVPGVVAMAATDKGVPGRDNSFGSGLINPRATLRGLGLAR